LHGYFRALGPGSGSSLSPCPQSKGFVQLKSGGPKIPRVAAICEARAAVGAD